jgi:NitT/TauT family transport system ATP-binding protein
MLEVEKICKSFTNTTGGISQDNIVLQDITFAAKKGEFITILGPSGCGKTTLIKIICMLIKPDAGRILINKKTDYLPGRDICMVFQNYGLLPWLTVLDNAAFGLKLNGVEKEKRINTARQYLNLVGLRKYETYFPHEISGGMQQRVGLARALANEPSVLIMDEPFGSVDAQTREDLQKELLRIWAETKNTIVFITHSIEEAIFLGDTVLVMRRSPGKIIQKFNVNIKRPRYNTDIRLNKNFYELAAELREMLMSAGDDN